MVNNLIGDFLRQEGCGEDKIVLATSRIISRAIYPASELKTFSYIKENPAISEITGLDREKITKDLLHDISHQNCLKLKKISNCLIRYANCFF